MKNYFLRACYLGFDWSDWIALIKSEILITTGMALPVLWRQGRESALSSVSKVIDCYRDKPTLRD